MRGAVGAHEWYAIPFPQVPVAVKKEGDQNICSLCNAIAAQDRRKQHANRPGHGAIEHKHTVDCTSAKVRLAKPRIELTLK